MEIGLYNIIFNYLLNNDKCNFIEHAPQYLHLYNIDLGFIKYIIDNQQMKIIKRLLFRGKLNDFVNKILWIAFDKHDLNCIKLIIKTGLVLGTNVPIGSCIRDSSEEIIKYFATPREIRITRDMKLSIANIQIKDFYEDIMLIKCRDGDLKYIKKFPSFYNINLMEIACIHGHFDIAQHIGNVIRAASDKCLYYAFEYDNYDFVKYLLKYCKSNNDGKRIMCEHGNLTILKLLLAKQKNENLDEILAIAYAHGHTEIADYLLRNTKAKIYHSVMNDVNINFKTFNFSLACIEFISKNYDYAHYISSVIIKMCEDGNEEIFTQLYDIYEISMEMKKEALATAIKNGHNKIAEIIIKEAKILESSVVEDAAIYGNLDIFKAHATKITDEVIKIICENGHLDLLKFIKYDGHDIMKFFELAFTSYDIIDYMLSKFNIDLTFDDFRAFRKIVWGGNLFIIMRVCQNLPKDWKSRINNYDRLIQLFGNYNVSAQLYLAKL